MTVKELIVKLLGLPMDAPITWEVMGSIEGYNTIDIEIFVNKKNNEVSIVI